MTVRSIAIDYTNLTDLELARLCLARDAGAMRIVISANNQRLFRAAWSILKSHSDAEEVVQAAYLHAFANMQSFAGRSKLSTWLTRIAINEALGRRRSEQRRRRHLEKEGVALIDDYRDAMMRGSDAALPEAAVAREQIRKVLEHAVAQLPAPFRTVFVLREVEGLTSEETAEALSLPLGTVKTRLLRARRRLQEALAPEFSAVLTGAFPFAGNDCVSMSERVLKALGL